MGLRGIALALLLTVACFATAAQAQIAYSAHASGGTFAPDAHYMQQITLNGPNVQFTINSFPVFGIRWNDVTAGTQVLRLTFWTNANTDPTTTNVLAGAINHGTIAYNLPAQAANGSYNYSLPGVNITIPGNTFALEVTLTNASQTAYSTAVAARYSTAEAPSVGSALNFVWADNAIGNSDGIFAGGERRNPAGTAGQTHQNIRMTIDATAVPEPSTVMLLGVGLVAAGGAWLKRRRQA